jgi:hypothetical protein
MSAEYVRNLEGHSNTATRKKPVANGVTVTDGDFVYQTGGRWSNAAMQTGPKRLAGVVQGGDTENLNRVYSGPAATVGDSAGTKQVLVAIEKDAEYLVKANATVLEADEGSYFNLVQGTGTAQQVDYATKSATTGQLRLLKAAPGIRGTDATYGVFVIALNERNA